MKKIPVKTLRTVPKRYRLKKGCKWANPDKFEDERVIETQTTEQDERSEDEEGSLAYQNSKYWALPENVRHAIDISKKKGKRSDFCN
tara:strand:+ start:149 stop:409 length:261 start_codon:yes stop_codon:yes gene_type:complete